jgi:DHA1 family tetracycline resistance protein-like MFS transporter
MASEEPARDELVAAATVPEYKEPNALSIVSVLLAAFLNLLGYTMTIPLGAALKTHFELPMGASFGLLSSAYPLGTLGAYFLWPQLSDRVGRKPVISMSLLGSGVGLALQSLTLSQGRSLQFFLGAKVFTGFCAGAVPVAKAYLADVGTTGNLPRYMAWRDAANTLAFIIGPLIGGKLFMASNSLATVIGVTAATSLFASGLTAIFMDEMRSPRASLGEVARQQAGPSKTSSAPPPSPDGFAACPLGSRLVTAVASVCVITALYNCGTATFNAVFAPLAQDLAGLDAGKIGLAYTVLASLSFAVSTTASAAVQRRLGTVSTCCLGLTLVGLGLSLVSLVAHLGAGFGGMLPTPLLATFWAAAAIYQIGVPLYTPTIPTMLLQCAPRHRRGALMGLDEACNTVARVCAPPFFLSLIASHGLSACTSAAAAAVFLGMLVAAFRRWVVLRDNYAKQRQR